MPAPQLDAPPGKGLLDMPNEVLFNVIENFAVDTEWPQAFDLDQGGVPWAPHCLRVRGNAEREETLRSLCLVCERTAAVSTSVLYSAIIVGFPGKDSFIRMSLLLRSITENRKLASLIKYIEMPAFDRSGVINKMRDALNIHIGHMRQAAGWDSLVLSLTYEAAVLWGPPHSNVLVRWLRELRNFPELAELALLIGLSPNVTHLKVGTNFRKMNAFLEFLGLLGNWTADRPTPAFHGLLKWKRFTLLILGEELRRYMPSKTYMTSEILTETMEKVSIAPELFIIGPVPELATRFGLSSHFPNLQSITFYDTNISERGMKRALAGSACLKRFKAVWDPYGQSAFDMAMIFPQLQKSSETLEYLDLTVTIATTKIVVPQYNFSAFKSLTTLIIPQAMLFGSQDSTGKDMHSWKDEKPALSLIQCLPPKLKTLSIVDNCEDGIWLSMAMSDDSTVWWDFVAELDRLPTLKKVSICGGDLWYDPEDDEEHTLNWSKLIDAFAQKGVTLSTDWHA